MSNGALPERRTLSPRVERFQRREEHRPEGDSYWSPEPRRTPADDHISTRVSNSGDTRSTLTLHCTGAYLRWFWGLRGRSQSEARGGASLLLWQFLFLLGLRLRHLQLCFRIQLRLRLLIGLRLGLWLRLRHRLLLLLLDSITENANRAADHNQ